MGGVVVSYSYTPYRSQVPTTMSLTLSGSDFSTCEISDALLKLGVPQGGHIPDIHRISPHPDGAGVRLCGPAYTVRLVLASEHDAPKLQGHFVDLAPEGTIAFVCAPPGQSVAQALSVSPPDFLSLTIGQAHRTPSGVDL